MAEGPRVEAAEPRPAVAVQVGSGEHYATIKIYNPG